MNGRVDGYVIDSARAAIVAAALTELAEHRRRNGMSASPILTEITTGLRSTAEVYVQQSTSVGGNDILRSTEMARVLSSADDDVLDPEKVGELLGVSDYRVRQLLRCGLLQGEKVGRHWIVRRGAVYDYQRTGGAVSA